MREVRFVSSDLAETGWLDATLTGCALAGVQSFLPHCAGEIPRLQARLSELPQRTLTDVTFENCLLLDTEFGGAGCCGSAFPAAP